MPQKLPICVLALPVGQTTDQCRVHFVPYFEECSPDVCKNAEFIWSQISRNVFQMFTMLHSLFGPIL